MSADDYQASAPFEGPEKLLEIWFAPSAAHVPALDNACDHKTGLRTVSRQTWEDMLDIVKCKVLSVIEGTEMDAYLLRSVVSLSIIISRPQYPSANHHFLFLLTGSFSKHVEQLSTF